MPEIIKNISKVNLRMRKGSVVFGDIVYNPGGVCGPRIQRDYQLVVMYSGSLDLSLDNELIHVPAGHAILLSPRHREHFLFSTEQETHHGWCAVDANAIPRAIQTQLKNARGPIPFVGRPSVLFQSGRLSAPSEDDPLQAGFYLGLGLALLCDFAQAVRETRHQTQPGVHALLRMDEFICNEYTHPVSLEDLAKASGVSKQHLLKLCRLKGLNTPIERLYTKRLEIAADLLEHTGLSVGEISDRCGFANAFHFSRKFKQRYNQSPLVWRKYRWAAQNSR